MRENHENDPTTNDNIITPVKSVLHQPFTTMAKDSVVSYQQRLDPTKHLETNRHLFTQTKWLQVLAALKKQNTTEVNELHSGTIYRSSTKWFHFPPLEFARMYLIVFFYS